MGGIYFSRNFSSHSRSLLGIAHAYALLLGCLVVVQGICGCLLTYNAVCRPHSAIERRKQNIPKKSIRCLHLRASLLLSTSKPSLVKSCTVYKRTVFILVDLDYSCALQISLVRQQPFILPLPYICRLYLSLHLPLLSKLVPIEKNY